MDESDTSLVLKNPYQPFRGAVLSRSDAPIPYTSQLGINNEVATSRRKRRSTVTMVSVCDVIFKESIFAR